MISDGEKCRFDYRAEGAENLFSLLIYFGYSKVTMGDLDHHHGNRLLLASQVGAAKFLLLGCCGPESDLKYFFPTFGEVLPICRHGNH